MLFFREPVFAELYLKQFISPEELYESYIAPLDVLLRNEGVGFVDGNEYDMMGNAVIVICIKRPNKNKTAKLVEIFEGRGKSGKLPIDSVLFIKDDVYKLNNK